MQKVILAVALLASFTSCKKNNSDSPSTTQASIVGTWNLKSATDYWYDANNKLLGSIATNQFSYIFKADGTVTVNSLDNNTSSQSHYTLTTSGGKTYLKIDGSSDSEEVSVLDAHNLTLLETTDVSQQALTVNGGTIVKIVTEEKLIR